MREQEKFEKEQLTNEEKFLNEVLGREENDPAVLLFNEEQKEKLKEQTRIALQDLTEKEQKAVKFWFRLDDNFFNSLDELAKSLDVTKERVRQIVAKTVRKMSKKFDL